MTASYFRDLASQCRKAARNCFDLFAQAEFRRLAAEFNAKVEELDFLCENPEGTGWWRPQQRAQSVGRLDVRQYPRRCRIKRDPLWIEIGRSLAVSMKATSIARCPIN